MATTSPCIHNNLPNNCPICNKFEQFNSIEDAIIEVKRIAIKKVFGDGKICSTCGRSVKDVGFCSNAFHLEK
jgi:hypothetical protein